jgi:hypothetical protein
MPDRPAMPIRLLALDVDGTLVNSRHELTPATLAAVRRAQAAGIEVLLATGRRYSRVLPLVGPLGLRTPVVTASGALIKHPADHRTLFRAEFAPGVLQATLQIISAAGFQAVLYADTFLQGFDYYAPRSPVDQAELAEFLAANTGSERELSTLMSSPPEGVFALFAMGTRDQMLALHHALQVRLGPQVFSHVLRSPRYSGFMCEIAPAGVTKWSAVRSLASDLGIPPDEICAVGDDVNDLPMIQWAGLGVAMGNAQEAVKVAAHRVAPAHDDDGLVQVVDWLLDRTAPPGLG